MSQDKNTPNNTLSLGGDKPECLSEAEPEIYNVIIWAINMTPKPTIDSIYKICGTADELSHLDPSQVKAAIAKALEEKKEKR